MPILRKAMKGAVASGEKGRLAYVYYLMTECYRQQGLQKSKDYLLFYKKARRFAVSEGAALLQERLDEMAAAA
jgi:hypothetical protein